MKSYTKTTTINFRPSQLSRLRQQAKDTGLTLSGLLRTIVDRYLGEGLFTAKKKILSSPTETNLTNSNKR